MRELFVYYRVEAADAALARSQVQALHAELRTLAPHLETRLLRRADEATGQQTWLETYASTAAFDPAGVSAVLQAEIERRAARLVTGIASPRQVEVFVACASPPAGRQGS